MGKGEDTYIPLGFELLEANEGFSHRFVGENRLVLLERSLADFRVVGLGDGILQEGLLQLVNSDNDGVDLRKRVLQVAFGTTVCQLNLLFRGKPRTQFDSYDALAPGAYLVQVDGCRQGRVGHIAVRRGRVRLSCHHIANRKAAGKASFFLWVKRCLYVEWRLDTVDEYGLFSPSPTLRSSVDSRLVPYK